MKKLKLIFAGIAFMACIGASVTLNLNYKADNKLSLENVEALAMGEGSGGCYGVGSVVCEHGTYYGKWY